MNTTTVVPLLSTQITTITTTDGLLTIAAKYYRVDNFSPVTLSPYWSRLARLLLISFLSVAGSIGNVFMISSVMVEDHLKKAGKFHFNIKYLLFCNRLEKIKSAVISKYFSTIFYLHFNLFEFL